jgi:hypothetical protein
MAMLTHMDGRSRTLETKTEATEIEASATDTTDVTETEDMTTQAMSHHTETTMSRHPETEDLAQETSCHSMTTMSSLTAAMTSRPPESKTTETEDLTLKISSPGMMSSHSVTTMMNTTMTMMSSGEGPIRSLTVRQVTRANLTDISTNQEEQSRLSIIPDPSSAL